MARRPAKASPAASANHPQRRFLVGIGASAGGLEALTSLFSNLPTDLNIPFVVAQHLSPAYRSMLAQLIGRETTMTVKEVEHGEALAGRAAALCRDAVWTARAASAAVKRRSSAFFAVQLPQRDSCGKKQ